MSDALRGVLGALSVPGWLGLGGRAGGGARPSPPLALRHSAERQGAKWGRAQRRHRMGPTPHGGGALMEREEVERRLCRASEELREAPRELAMDEGDGMTPIPPVRSPMSAVAVPAAPTASTSLVVPTSSAEGRIDLAPEPRDRREELSSSRRVGWATQSGKSGGQKSRSELLATLATVRQSLGVALVELESAEHSADIDRLAREVSRSEKIIRALRKEIQGGARDGPLRSKAEGGMESGRWMASLREGLQRRSTRQDLNLLRYTRPLATGVQRTLYDAFGGIIQKYDATAVSHGKIGWLEDVEGPRPIADGTAEFYRTVSDVRSLTHSALPSDITYILVPGLFSRHYYGYYEETLEWFRERGLSCILSNINSDAGIDTNAKILRGEILDIVRRAVRADHQVLLVGHSKGGLDGAAALSLYPEIKSHVAGLVCVQAPYGGSPIASDILSDADVRGAVATLMRSVFAGDLKCVEDLSHEVRQTFLAEHPLPDDVVCVCFHSGTRSPNSLVSLTAQYIRSRYGEESDGLVARRDAEVPGCTAVRLREEMDHSGPVFPRILKIWHGEGNGNAVVPGVGTTSPTTGPSPQWSSDDSASDSDSGDELEREGVAPGAPQLHEALAIMCLRRSGRLPAEARPLLLGR